MLTVSFTCKMEVVEGGSERGREREKDRKRNIQTEKDTIDRNTDQEHTQKGRTGLLGDRKKQNRGTPTSITIRTPAREKRKRERQRQTDRHTDRQTERERE